MPPGTARLGRTAPLRRGGPLARSVPLLPGSGQARSAATRKPLPPVSDKRRAENRERRAMASRRFADDPRCIVPRCTRMADDLHEPLTRARGGSIADEENTVPVCRQHNDDLTLEPEWGYRLHLLRHSWAADRPVLAASSPLRLTVLRRDGWCCTGCGCEVIDVTFALWCRVSAPGSRPETPALWLALCGICAELDAGELEYRGYVLHGENPALAGVMRFDESGGGFTAYAWDDGLWHAGPQELTA